MQTQNTPWSTAKKPFDRGQSERRPTLGSELSSRSSIMVRKKKGSMSGKLEPHKRRSESCVGDDQMSMSGRNKESYHTAFAQVSELISDFLVKTKDEIDRQKAMNA